MPETQTLTKFNALNLTVENATTIQGLASLCQAVSPHAAQGPAAGGIGCLGFHLSASKHFRGFSCDYCYLQLADRDGSHELGGF